MEQTWRWYGPNDPIRLNQIAEAGATGIVTALHQVPGGTAWSDAAIAERKATIEAAGLTWSVVESIPVTNAIKARTADWRKHVDAWKDSLRALGRNGVRTVCYNFMPIVDWTRTELAMPLRSGAALRFDIVDLVAFDVFDLKRPNAEGDYPAETVAAAKTRFAGMDAERRSELERIVLLGLPGSDFSYGRAEFLTLTRDYDGMTPDDLRASLADFHREIVPVAEEAGIRLAIHPDDPPMPLFGLPRIVSTAADIASMVAAVDSPANGLTFCTGSYGSRADNDLVAMIKAFAAAHPFPAPEERAHRGARRLPRGGASRRQRRHGGDRLGGARRGSAAADGRARRTHRIPMRPDHGHLLSADPVQNAYPGYSYIGRLKGLAEIRGVTAALTALRP